MSLLKYVWPIIIALTFILYLISIALAPSPANAQEPPTPKGDITYPPSAKTDKEKLAAVYNLLEQMRLEHNKQGAIALANPEYITNGVWANYVKIYWAKCDRIIQEQLRLREKIKFDNYTLEQWLAFSKEENEAKHLELFGDREVLKTITTKATSSSLDDLKLIRIDLIEPTELVDPLENYTTYTENDTNGYVTVTANKLDITNNDGQNDNVYKSYGANHFGDFEHLVTFYNSGGNGFLPWSISDGYHSESAMDAANNGIRSTFYNGTLWFKDETNGNADSSSLSQSTIYYCTIGRNGTTGTYKVYSDASRTTLVDTPTITTGVQTYEHMNAYCSIGAGCVGYIENLDLQEGGGTPSVPTVTTQAATSVGETTATLNGNITDTGGENLTHRGFVWDTISRGDPGNSTAPADSDYANYWTESGDYGTGAYNHGITGLAEGELYYARACGNNSAGWDYGDEVAFITKPDPPSGLSDTDHTNSTISISWTKGDGADNTIVRYDTTGYPADRNDGTGAYNGPGTNTTMVDLASGQIYYIRAWSHATESGEDSYSDGYAQDTAYTSPGNITNADAHNPSANSIDLEWTKGTGGDTTMVRAKQGGYPTSPADGTQVYFSTGNTTTHSGLDPNETWYYGFYAYDTDSGYYSDSAAQDSETTLIDMPTVTNSTGASNITDDSARLNGEITYTGGENPTVTIYWGDEDGGTTPGSWDNSEAMGTLGLGTFYDDIGGLEASKTYYYRCYAQNTGGSDWADITSEFATNAGAVLPTVDTDTANAVTHNSAQLRGEIVNTGGENCDYRGYVWDTVSRGDPGNSTAPGSTDYSYYWTESGSYGAEAYQHMVSSLNGNTTYWVRACAHNSIGWDYGNETSFTTEPTPPPPEAPPSAPTNVEITETGPDEITITWVKGAEATMTLVRVKRDSYPSSPTDGWMVYLGNETTVADYGLSLDTTEYYYSLWSWNEQGYSITYATGKAGSDGGLGMIAEIIFILGIAGIACWKRSAVIGLTSMVAALLITPIWADTGWQYAVPSLMLALALALKVAYDAITGELEV